MIPIIPMAIATPHSVVGFFTKNIIFIFSMRACQPEFRVSQVDMQAGWDVA